MAGWDVVNQAIELYQCERYRPLGGWSSDYLLPTDPNTYRARGTRCSWATIAEAESDLLAPGWDWDPPRHGGGGSVSTAPNWRVRPRGPSDESGWTYASGFNADFEGGSGSQSGLEKLARWRRLEHATCFTSAAGRPGIARARRRRKASGSVRMVAFVATVDSDSEDYLCPNVDLNVAGDVGRMLLEAVTNASLLGEWSFPALVELKWKLAATISGQKGDSEGQLRRVLHEFVDGERGVTTRVAEVFGGTSSSDDGASFKKRLEEVAALFGPLEREVYAAYAMRHFCPAHVCREFGSHICPLDALICPHEGCVERFCRYVLPGHERSCPFMVVPCPACEQGVRRGDLPVHTSYMCPKREVPCAFSLLGCEKRVKFCDMDKHLAENVQPHLHCLLFALQEEREGNKALATRVELLEQRVDELDGDRAVLLALADRVASLEARLPGVEQASTTAMRTVTELQEGHEEVVKEAKGAAEKEAERLTAMASGLGSATAELSDIKARVDAQGKALAAMSRASLAIPNESLEGGIPIGDTGNDPLDERWW